MKWLILLTATIVSLFWATGGGGAQSTNDCAESYESGRHHLHCGVEGTAARFDVWLGANPRQVPQYGQLSGVVQSVAFDHVVFFIADDTDPQGGDRGPFKVVVTGDVGLSQVFYVTFGNNPNHLPWPIFGAQVVDTRQITRTYVRSDDATKLEAKGWDCERDNPGNPRDLKENCTKTRHGWVILAISRAQDTDITVRLSVGGTSTDLTVSAGTIGKFWRMHWDPDDGLVVRGYTNGRVDKDALATILISSCPAVASWEIVGANFRTLGKTEWKVCN